MTLTVDWTNRIVDSSVSITDLSATHAELRALESSPLGMLYPPIITYKEIDLGGGAKFLAIAFISSFKLRFPVPGNYTIKGNLSATIIPVAGVYVERQTSAAFAMVSGTAVAPSLSPDDIASIVNAVWSKVLP